VHRKNILIYVQQDATLQSLFYLKTVLHVSGGTTTHYQERKQLYPQQLVFVTPLLLPAAIAVGSSILKHYIRLSGKQGEIFRPAYQSVFYIE
jgi:hypothetical protein